MTGCRERHKGLVKRGDPFLEGQASEVKGYHMLQAFTRTDISGFRSHLLLAFPHINYNMFFIRHATEASPKLFPVPAHVLKLIDLLVFCLFFLNNGSKFSLFGDSPGHHSQGTPTHGTRHRLLNPGARLALKHLSVAINKQLSKKINKLST